MDESILWVLAIGIGLLGLVLLAVGTLFAVYWSATRDAAGRPERRDRPQPTPASAECQSAPRTTTSASRPTAQTPRSGSQPLPGGSFLAWLKAWIFALVHAGTVSLVLGGITFFEDLARASEEIQHTGTVSFPKQLLPGTVTGSMVRKSLSEPAGGLLDTGPSDDEQDAHVSPSDKSVEWEVVDILDEGDS